MIDESAQEEAALHALGLLDADEAAAFERRLAADADLRALAVELREAAALLPLAAVGQTPPAGLKARVLARLGAGERGPSIATAGPEMTPPLPAVRRVVVGPWGTWVPWSVAAALAVCCGALALSRANWRREFQALTQSTDSLQMALAQRQGLPRPEPADTLRRVSFCRLEPVSDPVARPHAAVLWDASRREGLLQLENVPPAAAGKDYQLWVVEAGRKDAVNAGVVTLDGNGGAAVRFRPVSDDGQEPAAAFALSLERAGGVPKNEGPILFVGKL